MTTRAKFYLSSLELLPGKAAGVRVNLSAVCRGDRNAAWAKATPMGTMQMTIENPPAVKWWTDFMNAARTTGKQPELYIDIAPSEDGWPGDGHKFRPFEVGEGTTYGEGTCGECGLALDAPNWEYDSKQGRSVEAGKAHPNG